MLKWILGWFNRTSDVDSNPPPKQEQPLEAPPLAEEKVEELFALLLNSNPAIVDRALAELCLLDGEQGTAVLKRIAAMASSIKGATFESVFQPYRSQGEETVCSSLARRLNAEDVQFFVDLLLGKDERAAILSGSILKSLKYVDAIFAAQSLMIAALKTAEPETRLRILDAFLLRDHWLDRGEQNAWIAGIQSQLAGLAFLLDPATADSDPESVIALVRILEGIPQKQKIVGPGLLALTDCANEEVRETAIRCRISMLFTESFSDLEREFGKYLNHPAENVRRAALSRLNVHLEGRFRAKPTHDYTSLAGQLYGQIINPPPSTPTRVDYELVKALQLMKVEQPNSSVGKLHAARKSERLWEESFGELFYYVKPDWTSTDYVTAWLAVLSAEKAWDIAVKKLTPEAIPAFAQLMQSAELAPASPCFFQVLKRHASHMRYRHSHTSRMGHQHGSWDPTEAGKEATALLLKISETAWGEAALWHCHDKGPDENYPALKALIHGHNRELIYPRLLKLFERAESKLRSKELECIFQNVEYYRDTPYSATLTDCLERLLLKLKREKHGMLQECFTVLLKFDLNRAATAMNELQTEEAPKEKSTDSNQPAL